MSPLFQKWKELAHDYAAVPGREKWDEYLLFIYMHECALIAEVEEMERELMRLHTQATFTKPLDAIGDSGCKIRLPR